MAEKKLLTNEFTTNSVKIVDDALIINFSSDGIDKKKTMPLTDKGLAIKDGLAKIFANENYDPSTIRTDVKEGGRLYDCVVDLAKIAKEKQASVDAMFAELGLSSNPIDTL